MTFNPTEITERLRLAGEEWADKNAAAQMLEDVKKVIFAKLCNASLEKTVSAKENDAYARASYLEHITKMVEARREADRAKVKWITGQAYIELVRSKEATNRAERKSY